MKLITLTVGIAALAIATPAFANSSAPKFTASCPTGISVKSNGSGKIRINGVKVAVKTFNANSWEARASGVAIDIARNGSELIVSYTGKSGANGICQVTSGGTAGAGAPAGSDAAGDFNGVPAKDQQACLAAVSNKANNGEVDVLDAYSSEANNEVIVGVGAQKAKWQCLVKNGKVANVMSMSN